MIEFAMMRKASIFGAGLLLATASAAQDQAAPATSGECSELFAFVTGYVERNYAGFQDKVTNTTRQAYEDHKAGLRERLGGTSSDGRCGALLSEYVAYFRDPHLSLVHGTPPSGAGMDDDAIRKRFADWPARPVSEADVRGYFEAERRSPDPIEGIWEVVGSDYRLAVLPEDSDDGRYQAITLAADGIWWMPGQIKATFERTGDDEYSSAFYMRDHSLREETARLADGLLLFSSVSSWAQVYPRNPTGFDQARHREWEASSELGLRTLDDSTLLLRLPTFEAAAEAAINKLVEENWDRLSSTDALIIDIRGNPGGSTRGYHSLRPLLYTGPMLTPGLSHYATDDNIRVIQAFIDSTEITDELEVELDRIVAGMRDHLGGYVPTPDEIYETHELPKPRRVAVLADRRCVSTCEAFVWIAKQSEKTTVFGENTGGFMDYGSALMIETPSPAFQLQMPMARSNRVPQGMPLDNVGVKPDVRVPEEVLYWVDWAREQLP